MFNMHLVPERHVPERHVPERGAQSDSWAWFAAALGCGAVVVTVLFCAFFAYVLFSLPPHRLSKGHFPSTFHQSLEQSLPATLPVSLEFLNAAYWHGAGDHLILIVAALPQADVEIVEQQFVRSKNVLPVSHFTSLLGREANDSEIVFAGHSKFGGCIIHAPKDNHSSEVLFFTVTWEGPWP